MRRNWPGFRPGPAAGPRARIRKLRGPVTLDTAIALAPAPGVERRFEIAELRRIAARLQPCRSRGARSASRVLWRRSIRRASWKRCGHSCRRRASNCSISAAKWFPRAFSSFRSAGLRQAAAGAFWSGSLQYGGRHRVAVWARVNVSVAEPRVVAVEDLSPGRPIEAPCCGSRLATNSRPPKLLRRPSKRLPARFCAAPSAPEQRSARHGWSAPKAVLRGETVEIESREGAALVQAPGQAQASGAIGETILVLNPMSNKRFPARVTAKGKVAVGKGSL